MKKMTKKSTISLAIVSCLACLCGGAAVLLPEANVTAKAATIATSDFYVNGAGARLINDANGAGIRFHTRMTDAAYAELTGDYKTGTLIIPEIRYDGDLTLEDLEKESKYCPVHIDTTNLWWDNTAKDGWMQSTVYLYNIPEMAYGARYVARSYVQFADGSVTYTAVSPETSLADIAGAVINGTGYADLTKTQVAPYVVEETTVTYAMPDGSKQTETVAYGSQLSGPKYDSRVYALESLTDQYGNAVNLATYEATMPVTITPTFVTAQKDVTIAAQPIKDAYGANSELRAFVNGSTAATVTEGIPNGYNTTLRLDWYQQSTSIWKAGGNPFYRSCYNQTEVSGYKSIRFAFKLETSGDANVQIYPMHSSKTHAGVIRNEWLEVELVQTSTNVWTLTVTRLSDGSTVCVYENVVRNSNGLTGDVDSLASLAFRACAWDGRTPTILLNPCSSTDMTASIYMTELIGTMDAVDTDLIPSSDATTVLADALNGETSPNITVQADNGGETAPEGFNSVTRFYSNTTWISSILAGTDYDSTSLSDYSELWFALKIKNGCITMTAPQWKDIDSYTTTPWIYFHMTQTGTNDSGYALWDIEIIKDGTVWYTITNQYGQNGGNSVRQLFDFSSDDGRIVVYQNRNNLAEPVYIYSTEVRGILKDGVDAPVEDASSPMEIPSNAVPARGYIWRDDKYAVTGTTTDNAPEGYTTVIYHDWNKTHSDITAAYTYALDTTLDITAYSDLYFATKLENGSHIYVKDAGSVGHYTGSDWLYVHYQQVSAGVWAMSVQSPDGYSAKSSSTVSATTIKALIEGRLYGCRSDKSANTISYYTEIYGVPAETWGNRVIWSAADKWMPTTDAIGIPAGFTSIYEIENFAKDGFAAMDLTNSIYQELRFGMLANKDFSFNKDYNYKAAGEAEARPATTIFSNTSNVAQMYTVTLTKNDDGSWHVTMNCRRWAAAPTSGGSSLQTSDLFVADVTGNSLQEIMSTIMYPSSGMTLYVTEVRGAHTHEYELKSLGNGYLQNTCVCGETSGDPVPFAHGIPAAATEIRYSPWRDDKYALSASTTESIPAGFTNIVEFKWNAQGYMKDDTNFMVYILDGGNGSPTSDISAYSDLYFAIKYVNSAEGIYIRGQAKYNGGDWLYAHYSKASDGTWSLTISSPDGYLKENVQTGITATHIAGLMSWSSVSGFYPTRANVNEASIIYFTNVLGFTSCEHAATKYVSNGDGTHNEICSGCGMVMNENITCAGGVETCATLAVCTTCGGTYGDYAEHVEGEWVLGKKSCTVCGSVVDTAITITNSAFKAGSRIAQIEQTSVTAPEGFSTVAAYSNTGPTAWTSSCIYNADYNSTTLSVYDEVWFAIKLVNTKLVLNGLGKGDITGTTAAPSDWINFHLTQNADATWTVEVSYKGAVYATATEQIGSTISKLLHDGGYTTSEGESLMIYQHSGTEIYLYSTEVLGVFNTGISEYATTVWAHIWNPHYFTGGGQVEGVWSDEAAPVGFSKVSEYTWTGKDFAYKYGHFNDSDISAYSDIWFAMKATAPANIYLQGAPNNGTISDEWVYVHYHQVSDGVWTKDYRTASGYYSPSTTHVNITGTKLTDMISWKSGINQGSYPTAAADATATAYFTEVIGVLKCDGTNHYNDAIVSNGNGTHSVTCRCGVSVSSNTACSGGTATCTELAVCTTCGGTYGNYADHVAVKTVNNGNETHSTVCSCGYVMTTTACSGGTATCTKKADCSTCNTAYGSTLDHVGSWNGDVYECESCGEDIGNVDTNLDDQTSALFTNAETIAANVATALTIDLSSATELNISSATVTLGGKEYEATVENNKATISVLPNKVFGQYKAVVVANVEGKEFEITAPILVVTNMITTSDAMLDMKYILRGKTDIAKVANIADQSEKTGLIYKGGEGGSATMNGDGYYMLGGNVTLTQNDAGGYTDVYVWGTPTVPFVGTFDGNGYVISNFIKTNWFTGHTLEDVSVTTSYGNELEGSFFGYVNGTVKNVAFTNVQLGIYANIVLDGMGTFSDVYVEITNVQHNANLYLAPFFWRNNANICGKMVNVVFNMTNHNSSVILDSGAHTSSTHYPALTGKAFIAENVAVYGFNKNWIKSDGSRGNVYMDVNSAPTDGSAAGIYVEYVGDTTNGASFWMSVLSTDLWKLVDGVPMFKNVTASGTETDFPTNDNTEAGAEYNVVWMDHENGSYEAVNFINDVTKAATGKGLNVISFNTDMNTQQIVVGSYHTYMGYLAETTVLCDNGSANYGVYKNGNTIFVLAENEEAYMYAAKELCRQLYGWNEIFVNDVVYNTGVVLKDAANNVSDYTTHISFNLRQAGFTSDSTEKNAMGFTTNTSYSAFIEMHNAIDYFTNTTYAVWNNGTDYLAKDSKGNSLNQICYLGKGNADTFEAMVTHVYTVMRGFANANSHIKAINFMVEDNWDHCACSACSKFSEPSVPQILFLNEVARRLQADTERTIDIAFFAYDAYTNAPTLTAADKTNLTTLQTSLGLTEINILTGVTIESAVNDNGDKVIPDYTVDVLQAESNLRLWWTSHDASHAFPLTHEANDRLYYGLQAWIASVGAGNIDLFMYQVTYRDYFLPLNTWENQVTWYRELNALGIHSTIFNLGNDHNPAGSQTAFSAFKTYIDSRAMTDINATYEEIKAEFFATNGYYGAAGPKMEQYFDELVEVMNSRKQGGANAFVDLSNGYIDWEELSDWTETDDKKYRQSFFNGVYGYSLSRVAFSGISAMSASSGSITNATVSGAKVSGTSFTNKDELYVHDDYGSQQATLEAWYTYCQQALASVDANSDYATRIKVEALFPEYAVLMYHSTYTPTYTYDGSAWSQTSLTCTAPNSKVITSTYQDFYDRVVALGVLQPSEFTKFNGTNESGEAVTSNICKMTITYFKPGALFASRTSQDTYVVMYESFFKNWGVTF